MKTHAKGCLLAGLIAGLVLTFALPFHERSVGSRAPDVLNACVFAAMAFFIIFGMYNVHPKDVWEPVRPLADDCPIRIEAKRGSGPEHRPSAVDGDALQMFSGRVSALLGLCCATGVFLPLYCRGIILKAFG